MTKKVLDISRDASADDAWETMRLHRIHHLVVKSGATVVGVISERDLGGRQGARAHRGQTVGELMIASPISVSPTTQVRQAANLLRGHSIGCLPVIEDDKLVGIVTVTDVLEVVGKGTSFAERQAPQKKRMRRVPHVSPMSRR
jgi:acetoin utilization protein AcuB